MLLIAALMMAQFAAADGISAIYAMLPTIYREFSTQSAAIGWVVTAFFLVAATTAAIAGRLADVLGRRTVAISLLCLASVGGLLGSVASSVGMLICASSLIALSAVLAPILIGLGREHLSPHRLSFAIAAIAAAGCAGSGLIFFITGFIVDRFGRSGGYLSTAILALVAAAFLTIGAPRSRRSSVRLSDIDFARGILFGPAAGGLILAVETGSQRGWSTGIAPVLLVGSVLLAIYWWRNQSRQPRPLIDVRLLSRGKTLAGLIAMALLGLSSQGGPVFSLLLQQSGGVGAGFGLSATRSGLLIGLMNGTALASAPLAGWLARRWGARPIAVLGACVMAVGWIVCAFIFTALTPLFFGALLFVTGVNLATTPIYLLIVESAPESLTSGVAGLGNTLYNLGYAIGSQIILFILMGGSGAFASADNYRNAFIWLTISAVAILPILVLRAPRRTIVSGEMNR